MRQRAAVAPITIAVELQRFNDPLDFSNGRNVLFRPKLMLYRDEKFTNLSHG